jgi:hypothetical protein
MEPTPYIDEQTGERFYNVRQAAQIVKGVSAATVWRWADKGVTSFGFKLHVRDEPMVHHRRSTQTPRSVRQSRFLIAESDVIVMKELFEAIRKNHPGEWTEVERDNLECAFSRRRFRLSRLSHRSRLPMPQS